MKTANVLFGFALLAAACAHKTPPPVVPEPEPTEAPPPPPPPPPKCEALSEGCTGNNGTLARIRTSGFSVSVPNGWTYAQQDDATVASNANAIFVVTTYAAGADAKSSAANREAAFAALVKLLGIATPKHHVAWRSPLKETKAGALKVLLWQSDDAARGDKKGPVLVFGAELPDKSWVLGAGFVPADDNTESDKAILSAAESLAPSPPASTPAAPAPASAP
jgi:hypothetical protein